MLNDPWGVVVLDLKEILTSTTRGVYTVQRRGISGICPPFNIPLMKWSIICFCPLWKKPPWGAYGVETNTRSCSNYSKVFCPSSCLFCPRGESVPKKNTCAPFYTLYKIKSTLGEKISCTRICLHLQRINFKVIF